MHPIKQTSTAKMIPNILLLAFLFLHSSNAQSPKGAAALEGLGRAAAASTKKAIHEIEYLNSPKVQTTGDNSQVPIQIVLGQDTVIQKGSREVNFNNVPPGFYDPTQVSFPDAFQVLAQPHTYNLKDAFPLIEPPAGISRVWGPFPAGGHFEAYFGNARGTATNVSIEFGWIENDALTAGSYTSQIWTFGFRGWDIVQGPSGSFNGSDWETTTNIVARGDRFVFDFFGGPSDKVLTVSRIFYTLP